MPDAALCSVCDEVFPARLFDADGVCPHCRKARKLLADNTPPEPPPSDLNWRTLNHPARAAAPRTLLPRCGGAGG